MEEGILGGYLSILPYPSPVTTPLIGGGGGNPNRWDSSPFGKPVGPELRKKQRRADRQGMEGCGPRGSKPLLFSIFSSSFQRGWSFRPPGVLPHRWECSNGVHRSSNRRGKRIDACYAHRLPRRTLDRWSYRGQRSVQLRCSQTKPRSGPPNLPVQKNSPPVAPPQMQPLWPFQRVAP